MGGRGVPGTTAKVHQEKYIGSRGLMSGPVDRVYHLSDETKPTRCYSSKKPQPVTTVMKNKRDMGSRSRTVGSASEEHSSQSSKDKDRSGKQRYSDSKNLPQRPLPPPPGLKNVGNSCYANAALQCLLSTALPHALLSERNAHIIRRHSFNRKLLRMGSGSVDSEEKEKVDDDESKDADSLLDSYLSGMTKLYSLDEDDDLMLSGSKGDFKYDSYDGKSTLSPARSSAIKAKPLRRDDGTVGSHTSLTSDMYHAMKKRAQSAQPSEADLLCMWLTQELTQITKEYNTPPQGFLGEKRRASAQKDADCNYDIFGSLFGSSNRTSYQSELFNRVVDPGSITRHVHKISSTLRPYQQEDAHEFFRSLLSSLTMNGQNARLSSLFDGLLESSITCKTCRKSSLTRDRYMDLSLDIADRDITNLERALTKFIQEETLDYDNMVMCSRCKVKRAVTKGLRLATAPTMLVINYKRFAYDNYGRLSRLSKQVTFPLRLELKDYMSRANRGKPPPYSLVAVLVHRGRSCDCGHYFAYVKKGTTWYLANDAIVTKVEVGEVLSAQAYVLVYEVEGMKENYNFDSYSRYHRSFDDLVEGDGEKKHGGDRRLSWDFSVLTNIFEACEIGFCGAADALMATTSPKYPQRRVDTSNAYENIASIGNAMKGIPNKSVVNDTENIKESDAVQAYYKRGRSHTPSRQNRNRENEATNEVNIFDFEPRIESHRRAKSVSRVEDMKSLKSTPVKRYTKDRIGKRVSEQGHSFQEGDLPPLHHFKREREV